LTRQQADLSFGLAQVAAASGNRYDIAAVRARLPNASATAHPFADASKRVVP
jgi:hypothetical protein